MSGLTSLGAAQAGVSSGIESITDLLVVILDLNPIWWSEQLDNGVENGNGPPSQQYGLAPTLDQILIFLNSYLLIHPGNQVVVLGCLHSRSYFLYPPELINMPTDMPSDSRPEAFRIVNHTVQRAIQHILLQTSPDGEPAAGGEEKRETVFVGALSRSLCYIHRMQRESPKGQFVQGRVLVIEAGPDSSSHYMHFINTIFTAQKMNVKIDACVLGEDSILLQQAVDLTGGLYVKVENPGGVVQVLNSVFILDGAERSTMSVPEKIQVDYRAACFCHQKLIEVGYVCSVCLSVFCAFSPMCSTCQSTFKFMTGIKKRKPTDPTSSVPSPSSSSAAVAAVATKKARNGTGPNSNGKA
ncbi:General transcription factor IIH subunit 3 [Hypsibius exemplaris]|uniref:General transcription factor IIH subunit 3 n=1 Tax=Hypsibius exemplaris TaxID=2072580 RepID=A0A1W0WR49_HYPEX|nr:General transcription factor IIH subunit 3 [Hypsibius exemplaris]